MPRVPPKITQMLSKAAQKALERQQATAAMQRTLEGAQQGVLSPERIAQRLPTAVGRLEDPMTQNLIVNQAAMQATPDAFNRNMQLLRTQPEYSGIVNRRMRNPESVASAMRGEVADNLMFLWEQIPPAERAASMQWYPGANKISTDLATRFNVPQRGSHAAIAALSPQKDWDQNLSLAERVMRGKAIGDTGAFADEDMINTARRIYAGEDYAPNLAEVFRKPYPELTQEQKAMWVRLYDEAHQPRSYDTWAPTGERIGQARTASGRPQRVAWGSNNEIGKAIAALENPSPENISLLMGNANKVRNFYNNIASPFDTTGDVTIDTHAVAAGMLQPLSGKDMAVLHNFGSTLAGMPGAANSALTGARGMYGLYADAYRDAARQLGVLPREVQSPTWVEVRNLFPDTMKRGPQGTMLRNQVNTIWNEAQKGKITRDQARIRIYELARGLPPGV